MFNKPSYWRPSGASILAKYHGGFHFDRDAFFVVPTRCQRPKSRAKFVCFGGFSCMFAFLCCKNMANVAKKRNASNESQNFGKCSTKKNCLQSTYFD